MEAGLKAAPLAGSTAEQIVRACVGHLFTLLRRNGKFIYAHRYSDPSEAFEGYNLLRHCATVWFMCKAIRSLDIELEPADRNRLRAAVAYIERKAKEPNWLHGSEPTLCLTAKDVVKLGGAGLAVLMIRECARLDGEISLELASLFNEDADAHCRRFENYIVSQLAGGDFIHKRSFSTGDVYPFESEYYTGEVLFSLVQSPRRVPEIRKAMEQLLADGYGLAVQSHWMGYAACAALRVGYCNETTAADYLRRLIESIVSDPSYRERHQSTPIACRTEALVEILRTYQEETYLSEFLSDSEVKAAARTARENLALQLNYYGEGQFRKGRASDRVQIDFIQHNGASFLGWWDLTR
jgi:hypothetical protein